MIGEHTGLEGGRYGGAGEVEAAAVFESCQAA